MDKKLILIGAMDKNNVVGKDNTIPWKIKDDMKFFKDTTMGHPVIMGRKTFESMGKKPLKGRENIVLTKSKTDFFIPSTEDTSCYTFASLESYLQINQAILETSQELGSPLRNKDCIYVIGGAGVWQEALPYATHIYRTRVLAEVDGDVRFPEINESEWQIEEIMRGEQNERNEYPFVIEKLTRNNYIVTSILT